MGLGGPLRRRTQGVGGNQARIGQLPPTGAMPRHSEGMVQACRIQPAHPTTPAPAAVPEPLPVAEQEPGARHRRPHPQRHAGPRPPVQVGAGCCITRLLHNTTLPVGPILACCKSNASWAMQPWACATCTQQPCLPGRLSCPAGTPAPRRLPPWTWRACGRQ